MCVYAEANSGPDSGHLDEHGGTMSAQAYLPSPPRGPSRPKAQWSRIYLPMQMTQETRVQSLGWEDSLEEEMATHFSILAWKIPWTEEPGRSVGSQRVRHY